MVLFFQHHQETSSLCTCLSGAFCVATDATARRLNICPTPTGASCSAKVWTLYSVVIRSKELSCLPNGKQSQATCFRSTLMARLKSATIVLCSPKCRDKQAVLALAFQQARNSAAPCLGALTKVVALAR